LKPRAPGLGTRATTLARQDDDSYLPSLPQQIAQGATLTESFDRLDDPEALVMASGALEPHPDKGVWRRAVPRAPLSKQRILDCGGAIVVNLHRRDDQDLISWARSLGRFQFIGRPSVWGNPYRLGIHGDRDEVIAKFEEHLRGRPRPDRASARAARRCSAAGADRGHVTAASSSACSGRWCRERRPLRPGLDEEHPRLHDLHHRGGARTRGRRCLPDGLRSRLPRQRRVPGLPP
jgi:Domain of unknown function (DUF4326)